MDYGLLWKCAQMLARGECEGTYLVACIERHRNGLTLCRNCENTVCRGVRKVLKNHRENVSPHVIEKLCILVLDKSQSEASYLVGHHY